MNKRGDIIIVEDDPDEWEILLEVFEQVMDENGFDNRVVIFEESTMVVDFLKESEEDPFIIISDINMPYLDGFELCEKICNDPELKERDIPFIFLTTCENVDFMGRAEQIGVDGYYVKPTKIEEYKVLIKNILCQFMDCSVDA
ncbi:MAG: response regulator [Bacteroidota bacterium]